MRKTIKGLVSQETEKKHVLLIGDRVMRNKNLAACPNDRSRPAKRNSKRRLSGFNFDLPSGKSDLKDIVNLNPLSKISGSHSLSELCSFQNQNRL
jgi:hypothetical protein